MASLGKRIVSWVVWSRSEAHLAAWREYVVFTTEDCVCRVGKQSGLSLLTRDDATVPENFYLANRIVCDVATVFSHVSILARFFFYGGFNFRAALTFRSCGCVCVRGYFTKTSVMLQ